MLFLEVEGLFEGADFGVVGGGFAGVVWERAVGGVCVWYSESKPIEFIPQKTSYPLHNSS